MAWRFRKSIKIAPGVRLNLSKTGISASVGPRGMTVNVKPGRPTRTTVGLPGSGISQSFTASESPPPAEPAGRGLAQIIILAFVAVIAWAVFFR